MWCAWAGGAGTLLVMPIDDVCLYDIEVQDELDENAFNATSPLRIAVAERGQLSTLLRTRSDQSGLIGLMRHLHQQGFVLLSISRGR